MLHLVQSKHQSCIKRSTIPKRTKPSFHLSLVTKESDRVRPKLFLCLWYARCKPCSNLGLTLTLSPNGLKRDSTWPTSLTSSIGCVQNCLWPMVRSIQTMHLSSVALSPNGPNRSSPDPHHLRVPRVLLKQFINLWYVWRKVSTYLAPTLTLFQNRSKQDSTRPMSLTSSIGCVQNCLCPMVCSMQIVHLSSVALSPNGPNRSSPDPHHLRVPRVLLKQFMNLWYVGRKPSTYLAPMLKLFQNISKQDSTRPT
jgi:hypothetical protein